MSATPLLAAILQWAGRLRFPQAFALTVVVFLIDLIVPDPIPFADELLLGLLTVLFGLWRKGGRR